MEATERSEMGVMAEALASFFGADGPLAGAQPDFEAHVFDMSGAGKTEKAKAPEKAPGGEGVVLVAVSVGGRLSEKGRVPTVLLTPDGQEKRYSLRPEDIKAISYDGKYYYITYGTKNADYYRQNFMVVDEPKGLKCDVETYKISVCANCGHELGFEEEEEAVCLRCGAEGPDFHIKVVEVFEVRKPAKSKLIRWKVESWAEKRGMKLTYVGFYYRKVAGGYTPRGDVLEKHEVDGLEVEIMENLVIEESHWDTGTVGRKEMPKGRYLVAYKAGEGYYIWRISDMTASTASSGAEEAKSKGEGEKEAKMETKAYVLAYDLPSEYRSDYYKPATDKEAENHAKAKEAMRIIRATRIKATSRLYACGLPASNSVIVVPTKKLEEAQKAIDEVKAMYAELSQKLREMGFPALPEPLICLIPQVEVQVVSWASLAERELSKKLDAQIEAMAKRLEELGELEAKKAKSLKYKLRSQLRELEDVKAMAEELGIDISGKAQLLSSMIREAIETLEELEEEG